MLQIIVALKWKLEYWQPCIPHCEPDISSISKDFSDNTGGKVNMGFFLKKYCSMKCISILKIFVTQWMVFFSDQYVHVKKSWMGKIAILITGKTDDFNITR